MRRFKFTSKSPCPTTSKPYKLFVLALQQRTFGDLSHTIARKTFLDPNGLQAAIQLISLSIAHAYSEAQCNLENSTRIDAYSLAYANQTPPTKLKTCGTSITKSKCQPADGMTDAKRRRRPQAGTNLVSNRTKSQEREFLSKNAKTPKTSKLQNPPTQHLNPLEQLSQNPQNSQNPPTIPIFPIFLPSLQTTQNLSRETPNAFETPPAFIPKNHCITIRDLVPPFSFGIFPQGREAIRDALSQTESVLPVNGQPSVHVSRFVSASRIPQAAVLSNIPANVCLSSGAAPCAVQDRQAASLARDNCQSAAPRRGVASAVGAGQAGRDGLHDGPGSPCVSSPRSVAKQLFPTLKSPGVGKIARSYHPKSPPVRGAFESSSAVIFNESNDPLLCDVVDVPSVLVGIV